MLTITSVLIENIKGIASAEFRLGTLTVIHGDNGLGKSSILDAIAAIFEGGHDPDLLRRGAEKGRVELTLSNGTKIRKTVTVKGSTLDITTADGLKVAKAATFVAQLANGFSWDPVAFLEADDKKRAQYLLDAMPIQFEPAEIAAVTGTPTRNSLDVDGLAQLRQGIYDKRRDVNVLQRDIGATIDNLRASLPQDDGKDWGAVANDLRAKKADKDAELRAVKAKFEGEANLAKEAARAEYEAFLRSVEQECASKIAEEGSALSAELRTISEELGEASQRSEAQRRAEGLKAQIDEYVKKLDGKILEAIQYDNQLKGLDELKQRKLSESAIPGIAVVDGRVTVNGLPLDSLNTQQQYVYAFQICSLKCGDLGFMLCDRVESLVGQQWEDFRAAAKESGFQVIVARAVPDEPLALEVDGELVEIGKAKKGGK